MIDESSAAPALAADKAAFAAEIAAALPGAAAFDDGALAWLDSGLPDSTFNFVYRSPDSPAEFAAAVDRVIGHFRQRGLPFHWSLGLRADPAGAAETLLERGLGFDEAEPAMLLDLAAPRVAEVAAAVPGLEFHPVADDDALLTWTRVWGCGAPDDVVERWHRVYSTLPYGPARALRMFIGTLASEPVATVYVHVVADVATVHYVVTLPEHRRRGIGAAMTDAALREARAAGCRLAVLTASEFGIGVYRRLGFREAGLVDSYIWRPE
ncbi:GNAT family N-acetyltransferase [Actinospica robiniae]|uniref:GNAT family N-acetyltransferase n=1 Tax=Actinospica robiniae TaxID=304901 RepID=UPI000402A0FB|nr:GNAT family N-acetyltransferase [Actinospica robiniae]